MYLSHLKSLKWLQSIAMTITFIPVFVLCIIVIPVWCATGDYNGTYSGTFSGDDNGYWVAFIEDAVVTYYAWSTTNSSVDTDSSMSVDENGNLSGVSDINGTNISGTIVDGVVSGSYSNSGTGDSGILAGGIDSEPSPFAGIYSGKYSGDSSGTWSMTISANGQVETRIDGTGTAKGGVGSDGRLISLSEIGTGGFSTISDGSLSGIWVNPNNGDSGTTSGSLADTGDGGGGGGGGGCFIETFSQ